MNRFFFNALLFLPIAIFGCYETGDSRRPASEISECSASKHLDARSIAMAKNYGPMVHRYSAKYGLDWRLVMAVMKAESRFYHDAESERGAEGLMQIMPVTQAQIAGELGIDSTDFDSPHVNIRGGIYYLAKLYRSFDGSSLTEENHIRLTLASYNAGLGRVLDARRMASYVNDNPNEWNSVKNALSLLSRRYSNLHAKVWEEGRPSSGYFRDWQQTSQYVENVMENYAQYQRYFAL